MTKPIKTIQKSVFKWIIGIFLVILAILILLTSLVTTSPGENFLRRKAEQKLEEILGQRVIIGDFETNLFSRLQLNHIVIFQVDQLKRVSLLELANARIDYQLWHLLRRKLSVKSINIDSLSVTVFKDSSGFYNLPVFKKDGIQDSSGKKESNFQISLGTVDLNNIMIKYQDNTVPLELSLNKIDFNLQQNDLNNYQFQLQFDSGDLKYQNYPFLINKLNLSGAAGEKELHLNQFSLGISEIGFTGQGVVNFESSPYPVQGNFGVRGKLNQFSQFLQDFLQYKISIHERIFESNFKFSGNVNEPRIDIEADLPDFEIDNVLVKNGKLNAVYQANQISLDRMHLNMMGGSVSGRGNILLDSLLTHNFALAVEGISLSNVLQFISKQESSHTGLLSGKIESKGSLQDFMKLQIRSQFELAKVKYLSKPIPDLNTNISFNQGSATFELVQGYSKIQANLSLRNEDIKGMFSVSIPKLDYLAGFFNLFEVGGIIDITGTIAGSLKKPAIAGKLAGSEIHYQNFPIDSIYGNISYENGIINFEDAGFTGALSSIDSLAPIFHIPDVRGGFAYQGNFKGPIDNLKGNVTAQFVNPAYQNFQIDSVNVKITLDGKQAEINSFRCYHDSLLIELTGEYFIPSLRGNLNIAFYDVLFNSEKDVDHKMSVLEGRGYGNISASFDASDNHNLVFNIQGKKINIHELLTILPEQIEAGGHLDFQLNFSGTLEQPSCELQIDVNSPVYEQFFSDSLKTVMHIDKDIFYLDIFELFLKNNKTSAKGEIELYKTSTGIYTITDKSFTKGTLEGVDIDLRILKPLVEPDIQFSGNSSINVEWEGAVKKPDIRGKLHILDGRVILGKDTKPVEAIQFRAILKDSLFQIENFSGKIQEIPFNITGIIVTENLEDFRTQLSLNVSSVDVLSGKGTINNDSVNFNLNINDFNISILQDFVSQLKQLSGIVSSRLIIDGPKNSPYISGNFNIQKLAFQPNFLNASFSEGVVKINFDRDDIYLDTLFVNLNNGTVFASGNLAFQKNEITQLNFKTFVNNIRIVHPKEYIVGVQSAQLNYQKVDNFYELDGDIILGENRLLYNFQPKYILSLMKTVERPSEAPPDIIKQTRLNVRFRESDNLWVDNNLARLRLHLELGFIGTLYQPIITGRLSFVEGYILYLDRKFRINNGTMDFINPNRLNPVVDFKAETSIKSYQTLSTTPYQIALSINGALDELTVALTSEPPLDRSDIISLLTVGVTREQLTGKEKGADGTTLSDVLRRRVEMLSSQKISNYAARNIGSLFGFDELSIEGNLFSFGDSWGPQLLASKKISDKMEITYITSVGHMNEQRIRLDYILSKYFSLESQTDQRGRSGLDLKYRLKFK